MDNFNIKIRFMGKFTIVERQNCEYLDALWNQIGLNVVYLSIGLSILI